MVRVIHQVSLVGLCDSPGVPSGCLSDSSGVASGLCDSPGVASGSCDSPGVASWFM